MEFPSRKNKNKTCCCVYGCNSKSCRDDTIRFYSFPVANSSFVTIQNKLGESEMVDRRLAWIKALKFGNEVKKSKRVCSLHFTKSDFIPTSNVNQQRFHLKKNSVPSCNLPETSLSTFNQPNLAQIHDERRCINDIHKKYLINTDTSDVDSGLSDSDKSENRKTQEIRPRKNKMANNSFEKQLNIESVIIKNEILEDNIKMEDWKTKSNTEDRGSDEMNKILDNCPLKLDYNHEKHFYTDNIENIELEKELIIKDEIFEENVRIDGWKVKNETLEGCCEEKMDEIQGNSNMKIEPTCENEHFYSDNYENIKVEKELNIELIIKDEIIDENIFKSQRILSGDKSFLCHICNKIFNCKSKLIQHKRIHTGDKPFSCDICKKTFTQRANLNQHQRFHDGEKPFLCYICKKRFKYSSSLILHIKRIHSEENPFSCDICCETFADRSILAEHKRKHNEDKPLSCDICKKIFSYKSALVRHNRIHTGEKLFSCDICYKTFNRSTTLVEHKRIHTGDKPFSCDICNKTFNQKGALVRHSRIHTGVKPFSCNVCNKKFAGRSNLVKHKRIHSGEKPFSCDFCIKTFVQQSYLVSHKRVHIGEKPFSCDICNKSFTVKSKLVQHKQIHNGKPCS